MDGWPPNLSVRTAKVVALCYRSGSHSLTPAFPPGWRLLTNPFFLSGFIFDLYDLLKRRCMYSYALLEKGCYYLIQEKEQGPVGLIRVNMETDHCMYVSSYAETELTIWKKKTDPIFDILELLEDDKVKTWESIYNDSQDTYNYEEDEE
jgi:hypothetical protein